MIVGEEGTMPGVRAGCVVKKVDVEGFRDERGFVREMVKVGRRI